MSDQASWRLWPGLYTVPDLDAESPYDYERIAIQRRGSDEIRRVDTAALLQNPWFNVSDLMWRPAQ